MCALGLVTTAAVVVGAFRNPPQPLIERSSESAVHAVISSGFGTLHITKGESDKILVVDSPKDENLSQLDYSYAIRNNIGYLELFLGEGDRKDHGKKHFVVTSGFRGEWALRFSKDVPVSFDIELGLGKGVFDLSGLQVQDFTLSTGASDVYLTFSEPNTSSIQTINIESGVSRFTGMNLGNANFRTFKFQGGLGSYTLDFSGDLRHEVDVDVEVGLGAISIIVPKDVGARVNYDQSFISRVDYDRDFRKGADGQYLTDNYTTAGGKMNITIESGLGTVKVRRK